MGNAQSIHGLSSAAVADLLVKENGAFQTFAQRLFHGDGFLSIVDGNYLMSLDLEKPTDKDAFESILDTMEVSPAFVRKSLENLLRSAQERSAAHPRRRRSRSREGRQQQQKQQRRQQQQPPTSPKASPPAGISSDGDSAGNDPSGRGAEPAVPAVATRRYADVVASGDDMAATGRLLGAATKGPKGKPVSGLKVGDTVSARVRNLTGYGAFMDIGAGRSGLLHISQLSVDYVADVRDVLERDKEYQVRITDVVNEDKKHFALSLLSAEEAEAKEAAARTMRSSAQHCPWSREEQQPPMTLASASPKVPSPGFFPSNSGAENNSDTRDAEPTTAPAVASHRYADVVASSDDMAARSRVLATKGEAKPGAKTGEVQLFLATPGCKTIRFGPVTLVDPSPQTQQLWNNLTEIVLEGYTKDSWARQVDTNATIEATDDQGKNEIAGLTRILGGNRMAVYGRFLSGSSVTDSGSSEAVTGALVVSYLQSMKNKTGQLECRIEKTIRKIQDCPLEPLPSPRSHKSMHGHQPAPPSPATAITTTLTKLSAASPPFRTMMATASSASARSSVPPTRAGATWTPIRSTKSLPSAAKSASPTTVVLAPVPAISPPRRSSLVKEPAMIKFRQLLDDKLEETFAARSWSAGADGHHRQQRGFLEATDLWNEQQQQQQPGGAAFGELSDETKGAFVCVVEEAVRLYDGDMVVRKNSRSMKRLSHVTIFKNEEAAKERAASAFGKTRLCLYWLKGACIKGDQCTYAHGKHELVGERFSN